MEAPPSAVDWPDAAAETLDEENEDAPVLREPVSGRSHAPSSQARITASNSSCHIVGLRRGGGALGRVCCGAAGVHGRPQSWGTGASRASSVVALFAFRLAFPLLFSTLSLSLSLSLSLGADSNYYNSFSVATKMTRRKRKRDKERSCASV